MGAIWLQFEDAVSGNKEYRKCLECGTPFEVAFGVARDDKSYCSNSCRSKAYRERVKHAQTMWKKGISIEEIATQLDADEGRVKEWISSTRKEK